ncbi:MAG: hypothetical protein ACM3S0_13320 [Acidobacteriota bacterium]
MKNLCIHPLLLALFPVLFLFAHNGDELAPTQLIGPLAVVVTATILLWFLFQRLLGDGHKAAVLLSVSLVLAFSFGRVLDLLVVLLCSTGSVDAANDFLESKAAQLLAASSWMLLLVLVAYLVRKTTYDLRPVSQFLNIFALTLIVLVAFNGLSGRWQAAKSYAYAEAWHTAVRSAPADTQRQVPLAARPDIFYIVLDEYAREDVLENVFGIDNSRFEAHLRQKGFYLAEQSTSNYSWTQISLASSLNFTYLDELADQLSAKSTSLVALNAMIRDNRLSQQLRNSGYRIVNFASGFGPTEDIAADVLLSPPIGPSGFDYELLKTTPLSVFGLPMVTDENERQRERILYTFDHLASIPRTDQPVFVFAHVVAPHPPFVFGPQGQPLSPNRKLVSGESIGFTTVLSEREYLEGYRDQTIFITSKVQSAIDEILSRSRRPTIIVLQADHGPGRAFVWPVAESQKYQERFSILNAFYFSDGNYSGLYPGITPVNTFRLILNRYLGYDFRLMADRNYFSTLDHPYDWTNVTDTLRGSRTYERATRSDP